MRRPPIIPACAGLLLLCISCIAEPPVCVDGINNSSSSPDSTVCNTDCDCNNQRYTGTCQQGHCTSFPRESCRSKGAVTPCIPPTSQGAGRCQIGSRTCGKGLKGLYWGDCLPPPSSPEQSLSRCRDGIDNDCDGKIDSFDPDCAGFCSPGSTEPCYNGPAGTMNVGACRAGVRQCNNDGKWDACKAEVTPSTEECNGKDDDCNGKIDDASGC